VSRRVTLPGADELFRATGGRDPEQSAAAAASAPTGSETVTPLRARQPVARGGPGARRPSGRERHDEKITVYVSPSELVDLEHARLTLRAEHGLAVDRGRIVREALAVVIADLEAKGTESILVRRLRDS
jgi:hypothetical protein